jgi:hypothetical protein
MENVIVINNEEYVKKSSIVESNIQYDLTDNSTFLVIGKVYLFRTVTMIYLGRIKAMTKNELLLSECSWIPETDRWSDTVKNETFKEVEPYCNDVILFKNGILDVTEMNKTNLVRK